MVLHPPLPSVSSRNDWRGRVGVRGKVLMEAKRFIDEKEI
jgi:hypothetical protein